MAEAGSEPKGLKDAIQIARLENRIDQALRDAKAVLEYIKTKPAWMRSAGATMTRAIQNPERARRLKRQANYQKTFAKRQSAKTPAPAPQKSSADMDLAADWNFWRNEADSWPEEQRKTLHALENDRARFVSEAARLWKAGLCGV
jgi:hypothetical protein